jgi:predicted NodU family carbamoyl transferase
MHILSIYLAHDGAFSIAKDHDLLIHCQLDRFNRIKHSCEISGSLLIYLQSLNIVFDVVLLIDLEQEDNSVDEIYYKTIFSNFKLINKNTTIINFSNKKNRKHHLLHAYCSKVTLGDNQNYFIADGGGIIDETGECERESIYDKNFNLMSRYQKRIGLRYGNITSELFNTTYKYGFHYCGKTMALSQYGSKIIESASNLNEDMNNIECQNFLYSLQKKTEKDLLDIMPKENVNYSGGVAQNILANSNFINYKNFKIDPMCIDSGISLGLLNYFLKGDLHKVNSMYLGPEPNYDYLSIFNKYKIVPTEVEDVAKILKDEPVALFQGRSEQGQRGLGNRSLLMNCHHKEAMAKINVIKKREWYRPFSPSVVEEKAKDYFDMQDITSPYMLYAFKTKQYLKNVSAYDGSSRVQTVNKQQNSAFYELLKASGDMLLNTSLNFPGQVLVENILDLKYMLDMSPLKYAWLPDINQLIIKK